MAIDTTIYLENDANIESNFDFVNRDGNASDVKARNTAGEWCLETDGSTTSSSTGASANPSGRSDYLYIETSSPAASTAWLMTRKASYNANSYNIHLDLLISRLCETASEVYVQYATVPSPGSGDWTTIATFAGTTTDAWNNETIDFSAINTDTLWIRLSLDTDNNYTNDFCFSTWRIYGTDKNTDIGEVTDTDSSTNQINESAPNGTTVGITAEAIDVDSGDTVSYSLTNDASGRFTIHSTSGVVTVADASNINYSANTNHDITVRATSSDTSFSDETFNITVISDAPVDIGSITDTDGAGEEVYEDCSNGETVGITAHAEDDNYDDSVSYSLDDDAGGRFEIHSTSGVITVLSASLLVYNDNMEHDVTVRATSSDTSYSTRVFTIDVLEELKPEITPTAKFKTIKTTGNINFVGTRPAENLNLVGDVFIDTTFSLKNVTIYGNLTIDTGEDSTVNFVNVQVTGSVSNADASHTLTINASSGTSISIADPGTGNGETNVVNTVPLKITVATVDGTKILGARVRLMMVSDNVIVLEGITDVNGELSSIDFNYSSDVDVYGWARKSSAAPFYKQGTLSGTITYSGFAGSVGLVSDE